MSVIKVDTILNKDGTGGPVLSGLTTVGILTGALAIGGTTFYAEEVVAGIITSVVSLGVTNIYASGTLSGDLSGDGSSITAINADNISSGTLANARTSASENNDASTIVVRSALGNFSAGTITADLTGTATTATNLADAANITTGTISNDRLPSTITKNLTGNVTGNVTGNADTATAATRITLTDQSADTTCSVVFCQSATGDQLPHTGSNLTFNSSTGRLAASIVQGNNIEADTNLRVGSATTSNSLYVVGNSASNVVGLTTQSSSFALDFSLGNNFAFEIGGNITLNNPTGITTGQSGIIEITQDSTGSRTMAFQSHWNFPDGTAPTITAGAGTTSVLAYFVKDADMIITTSILALG